ncbi:MAG: cytochrome c oxidase subunit [Acidimicrobiaceae bacterium]|jgi:heme/copper-type cytochrome/quinol oxidase subunit 3
MTVAMVGADVDLGTPPPPPPARPRVLLIGTVLGLGGVVMAFAGVLGYYIHLRALTHAATGAWLPERVSIPLVPGNMGLVTLAMSVVLVQWAVYAIANDDRRNTYIALGLTVLLGLAHVNAMAFAFTQIAMPIRSSVGVLFYTIMTMHLAMVGAGLLFLGLMAFRTLGGQYSGRDREGVAAAAIFWYVTVAVYAVIWYTIFVTK